jgi:nitrite reductase/ring-hydroxylating ferredoxin subunit/DMSO/TMAO reductase YedYZ heme-binding membrane subunit
LRAVSWTPFKKRYDLALTALVVVYLASFVAIGLARFPLITFEILLIRAFGTAAILVLQFILIIGPMARLDRRWVPLLANRRHLGVTCFLLGLIHGALVVLTYHVGGTIDPILSIFVSDAGLRFTAFPFQAFGFVALLILYMMAATSHDFWLAVLTAPVWKSLHMFVYIAWLLLVIHVVFGVLQSETHPVYALLTGIGVVGTAGLHLLAGFREREGDRDSRVRDQWVDAGEVSNFKEGVARPVNVAGDRVAVVRIPGERIAAVSGVCQHQNGPLSEGRFIDGCLTCPWHGFQYQVEDGCSPPPFTEKIPVFRVKIQDGRVLVHEQPLAPGTHVEPASIGEASDA